MAAAAAGETVDNARSRALDPAASSADVSAARNEMDDAAFQRDRLQEAQRRLGERLRELRREEEQARRLVVYKEAAAERDKLVEELAATYPKMAAQLADLVSRIDANDRHVEWINERALPAGVPRLEVAELLARDLKGFVINSSNVPRITKQMKLPTFQYDRYKAYAWPRA